MSVHRRINGWFPNALVDKGEQLGGPTMNKFELLRTFNRVSELASFTQAGESLGLPRSTVSEQIRLLEELLGTRLFQRTTRKVQATPDGQALYERSKDMLEQMDELEGLFRQDASALTGRLRVDMPTGFARKLVMPRIKSFIDEHPLIDLEISCTDRRVDLISEGFDCVLRIGELAGNSLVGRNLGHFAMVNCVSAEYAAAHGVPGNLKDLAEHRLVDYASVFGAQPPLFEYRQDGKSRSIVMKRSVTVNNIDAYESACLAGLGIIQAPLHGMREHLRSGLLVEVLADYPASPLPVTLLYGHRRHLPKRCRVFMQWLEALLVEEDVRVRVEG